MSEPTYLDPADLDSLARMVMALLSELWITRDRLAVLEKLIADAGLLPPTAIDDLVPDSAFEARLDALRAAMVEQVLGAPASKERASLPTLRATGELWKRGST